MKIKTDKDGMEVLKQLCDIALKHGGINNLQAINKFLQAVEIVEVEEE